MFRQSNWPNCTWRYYRRLPLISQSPVVLVHGLWMGAWAMRPLLARLRASGREVHVFDYPTRTRGVEDNADHLAQRVRAIGSTKINFVSHSLGGLVTLHALDRLNDCFGRAVLLGSPINGSATAKRFASWPGAQLLLGKAVSSLDAVPPTPGQQWRVDMIAGSRRLGLGMLVAGANAPAGDGTVAVTETQADWLHSHTLMVETHSSLLVSKPVADAVIDRLSGAFVSGVAG